MAHASPPPSATDSLQLDCAMRMFLVEIAALMELPASAADALANLSPVRGGGGFLCRLELARQAPAAVRPEVLLPIGLSDLTGADVEPLLLLQEALAAELRWRLGLSVDGRLRLTTMDWIDDPSDAAFAMDLGQFLGRDAMRALLG
jgi:hypothetical protein